MNRPFLQRVAEDLHTAFRGHFDDLTIVLPNKRTHLFLDEHIAALSERPIWAPAYATIRELFAELSTLTVADPILAVCLLHPIFQQALQQQDSLPLEDLDHFFSWGQVLLNDFEDIDNNLVDVRKLFANIDDLERLSSNTFLNDRQEAAIQQFFSTFSREGRTRMQQQFGTLWSKMPTIYEQFQHTLLSRRLAYEGMMKRRVVEQLQALAATPQAWQHRQFAIVGFNVLSESERQLFKILRQRASTRFYWDDDPTDTAHEAIYRHVRANITRFGQCLPPQKEATPPPTVTLVAAPTDNAQSRYAGKWLEEEVPGRAAIVLCDEALLLPVLHALPPTNALNVTMGFPMQQTPAAAFLNAILAAQANAAHSAGRLHQQSVVALLQHPYTPMLQGAQCAQWLSTIRQQRLHILSGDLFSDCPLLQQLLTPQPDSTRLLALLDEAIHQVAQHYGAPGEATVALHGEAIATAHRIINQLRAALRNLEQPIPANTLARLLGWLLRSATIPFHGEPVTDVQVLGLLETRNLHFERIVILSANEGNLPKDSCTASFIPYNLRQAYGLSTREQTTDLYAYYLHRLMQGARTVDILFNASTDSLGKGERSRFLTQMLAGAQPPARLRCLQSQLLIRSTPALPCEGMAKTPPVMQALRQRYDTKQPQVRYLSATALNTYLACPLRFALQYVARLTEVDDPLDSEVDASDFGSIFHQALQLLYTTPPLGLGRRLQAGDLLSLVEHKGTIEQAVDRAFHAVHFLDKAAREGKPYRQRTYSGAQRLSREVLVRYVRRQLTADATRCPLYIEAVEDESNYMDIPLPQHGFSIRLGGIIDRIDTITINTTDPATGATASHPLHRIVDYKTSTVDHNKADSLDAMFQPKSTSNHVFQTCYYADIYTTLHPGTPLAPALAYVKFAATERDRPGILIGGKEITDFAGEVKADFHARLLHVIEDIFDPAQPFSPAPSDAPCTYCPFTALCPRPGAAATQEE